jgi:dGTPase
MAVEVAVARAPYASAPGSSRGRLHPEPVSPTRNAFRRDCDRIIHATAFRRLAYKTQVFVLHEGDPFRTRLTPPLDVTQSARSLARAAWLAEGPAEGRAWRTTWATRLRPCRRARPRSVSRPRRFDHNAQTLRVVTALERRYPHSMD